MLISAFYLHFVTDLRRAVFCLRNHNHDGAKTFIVHAHTIYEQHLKNDGTRHIVAENFDTIWLEIYTKNIPDSPAAGEQWAEQILTLSSIIFTHSQQSNPHFSENMVKWEHDLN